MKRVLSTLPIVTLFFIFLAIAACDSNREDPNQNSTQSGHSETQTDSEDAPDSTELHIQSIRNLYGEAMSVSKSSFERNCDDGALVVVVDTRKMNGKLVWIRHTAGYDHGSVSHEALISENRVVFVMKEERRWNFDPDQPPSDSGESYTIDQGEQHRYYFMDDQLIRSLFKSAEARSSKSESLDKKLQEAPNRKHPAPDAGQALQKAKSIVSGFQDSGPNAYWCSL